MLPGPSHLREYVDQLALPERRATRGESGGVASPVKYTSGPQVVTVGAQLAEFTPAVDADTRSAVADSLLIAQLAANKAARDDDVIAWYRSYAGVLQNLGWLVEDLEFKQQAVADDNVGMHTAIIPVITAMLAPGAAALPLVISVLNGLKEMDTSSKWIALFDRASQHARGAKFQLSHVDAGVDGCLRISILCFGLEAQRTLTHVLFVKFSRDSVTMRNAHAKLSISPAQLHAARAAVGARVRPYVVDFVQGLDL